MATKSNPRDVKLKKKLIRKVKRGVAVKIMIYSS